MIPSPKRTSTLAILAIVFAARCAAAQLTVGSVEVKGNSRLPASSIVQFSGLRPGHTTSDAALNEICSKLVNSGFFLSARYAYAPQKEGTGWRYLITLVLAEDPATAKAAIEIDGVDESAAWAKAAAINPLVVPVMPDNDLAQTVYEKTLSEATGKPHLDVRREGD